MLYKFLHLIKSIDISHCSANQLLAVTQAQGYDKYARIIIATVEARTCIYVMACNGATTCLAFLPSLVGGGAEVGEAVEAVCVVVEGDVATVEVGGECDL